MNRTAKASANDWNSSAGSYASAAHRAPSRYATIARAIVTAADVRDGMHVVDLACGSGVVTESLLQHPQGRRCAVTAIDYASEMLEAARNRLSAERVTFTCAPADAIARVLPVPADRVLCSAAFWYMNMSRVLREIRRVLTAGGRFVVSVPDSSRATPISDRRRLYGTSKLAWMILEERECLGRPLPPARAVPSRGQEQIVLEHALEAGYRLCGSSTVPVRSSSHDTLRFLRMPAVRKTSPLLAGLSEVERTAVLGVVEAELEHVEATVAPKWWVIYVFERDPTARGEEWA